MFSVKEYVAVVGTQTGQCTFTKVKLGAYVVLLVAVSLISVSVAL